MKTEVQFMVPKTMLIVMLFTFYLVQSIYSKMDSNLSPTITQPSDVFNIILSLSIMCLSGIYIFWILFAIIRSFEERIDDSKKQFLFRYYAIFTFIIVVTHITLVTYSDLLQIRDYSIKLLSVAFINFYSVNSLVMQLPVTRENELTTSGIRLDEDNDVIVFEEDKNGSINIEQIINIKQ